VQGIIILVVIMQSVVKRIFVMMSVEMKNVIRLVVMAPRLMKNKENASQKK